MFYDFRVLIPNQSKGESAMFINFIEIGHNHLLKHPLCESFLHLKWLKVRKFFFISLIFHSLFTLLQTIFVLQVYAGPQCVMKNYCLDEYQDQNYFTKNNITNSNNNNNTTNYSVKLLTRNVSLPRWSSVNGSCFFPMDEICKIDWSTIVVWVFLLMSTFILGAKEAFQLMHSQKVISI